MAAAASQSALLTLRCMAGMLSGAILIAAFGLVAVAGIVLVLALFRVTRAPAADTSRAGGTGISGSGDA